MQRYGTTRHIERTRQHAFSVHPAFNTVMHHLPDTGKPCVNFRFAAQRQLVVHHQARYRQAVVITHFQQFTC
ncbi:Uncharacterised protein [Shigella flexneri]|nr:Uncharacterised protein [Shigella flexneri]